MGKQYLTLVLNNRDIDLYLLDLPLDAPGYRYFLTAWLIRDKQNGTDILVDTGPASTVEYLFLSLEELGISSIDLVLLTHVHLDHGGAIGHVMKKFPESEVVVSERGARHIVDPSRLWEGSVATLGKKTALSYGKILPVDKKRIKNAEKIHDLPLKIIETPGHSSHHISFYYRDLLLTGEAAGAQIPFFNKSGEEKVWKSQSGSDNIVSYLRPATPPPFFFNTTVGSIEKLLPYGRTSALICYAHYGYSDKASEMLELSRDQLFLWKKIIEPYQYFEQEKEEETEEKILLDLLGKDPMMKNFPLLDQAIQRREIFFLKNSIRGFLRGFSGGNSMKNQTKRE